MFSLYSVKVPWRSLQWTHSTHPLLPPQLTAEGRPPVENRQDLTVFWTESCPLEKEQGQCTQEEHTDPLQLGLSEAVTEELTFCPAQRHLHYTITNTCLLLMLEAIQIHTQIEVTDRLWSLN